MNEFANHDEKEKGLLSRVIQGDVKSFEHVYTIYSPRLYAHILRFVKSAAVAEELLQDTFQRVWEYKQNIDPDKSFKPYLSTIARNLVYDYFNSTSRRRLLERHWLSIEENKILPVSHPLEVKETEQILEIAVCRLPPQRKLVYTLCKLEGKSYKDVSKTLGISESTISDHIVKATKSIKAFYLSKSLYKSTVTILAFFQTFF